MADPDLLVSLEAIFLSAFVLIGQNREGAMQKAKADHDYAQTLVQPDPQRRPHRVGQALDRSARAA